MPDSLSQKELSMLLDISQTLNSTLDLEEILHQALERLTEVVDAEASSIWLIDELSQELYVASATGEKSEEIKKVRMEMGKGIVGQVISKERSHLIPDARKEPAHARDIAMQINFEARTMLCVPMFYKNKVIGAIEALNKANGQLFNQTDMLRASFFANMAGIAIENARLYGMALHKHKVEKVLRESEAKYRTLFEESKDVVYISTPEGKLVDINSAGVELFGCSSKEELLKMDIVRNLYMNPSDWETYRGMIEQQGFVKDYELVLKRKNGQQVIVVLTANAVRDDNGIIVAYQGIMRDVTERKRLEQQLFQAQKMASLGVMAGGVAHEINNPLNIINGAAQLLEKRYLDEFAQKSIKVIRDAVSRASRIVNNLLDFARRETHASFELLSVNRILEDTLSMLENQINLQRFRRLSERPQIKINKNLANDLPFILGNANQLQQVIMNLMLNAQSAMPKGGELSLETTHRDDQVVIKCSDTGEGISADNIENIFDPFYTTRAPGEGTGLGLSVSYQIIKQHNGVIEVYSAGKNKGSTFTIKLPVYKEPQSPIYRDGRQAK